MLPGQKLNTTDDSIDESDNGIGGGSVNEKKRQYRPKSRKQDGDPPSSFSSADIDKKSSYNPSNHRSHLLHVLEGLNRYPNYLSRWESDDVEALEQELHRVLKQVQEQKSKTKNQRDNIGLALRDFFENHPEWQEFSKPPESWDEIREILDPRAAKVVFRSKKIGSMMSGSSNSTQDTRCTFNASHETVEHVKIQALQITKTRQYPKEAGNTSHEDGG